MRTNTFLTVLFHLPLLMFSQVKVSVGNGNWNSANTWSPSGVPSSSDKIKIYHVVTLNQNFSASDTIFVYNQLNFSNNKSLSLNPGTMILVNDGTYNGQIGQVGNSVDVTGNFTFQKWVSRCDGFSTYGVPFNVSAFAPDWYYCNQCMPSWSNLYYYSEKDTGSLEYGYYDTINNNLKRGKGFFYWYSNYSGGLNFPRKISLQGNMDFSNDFVFDVSYTRTGSGVQDDGYNLIANPFPGTIDWLSNAWNKKKINNAIYTWNSCNAGYSSFVGGVGVNGGSRYISSMQGFWVQANGNEPELKAHPGVLSGGSSNLLKPSSSDTNLMVLRLQLGEDEIAIRLDPSSGDGFDSEYDALKMMSDGSRLYSGNNDGSNHIYAINCLNNDNQHVFIHTRGEGALSLKGFESFQRQYHVFIKDLKRGEQFELNDNSEYAFRDSSQQSFEKRFEIWFVKKQITGLTKTSNEDPRVQRLGERIYIDVPPSSGPSNVSLYDLFGRNLYSAPFEEHTSVPYQNCPVILRVETRNGVFVKKML